MNILLYVLDSLRQGKWKWLCFRGAKNQGLPNPLRHPRGSLKRVKRLLDARMAASGLLFDLAADPREKSRLRRHRAVKMDLARQAEAIIAGLKERSQSVVGRAAQEDDALLRRLHDLGYLS